MAFKLSPVLNEQQFSNAGILLSGGKIETYLAGSSTPATTYTSPSGAVAQANPIILNSRGEVDNLIYLTTGISYKLVLKDSLNNVLRTYDNIEGVNDSSLTIDQWVNSGVTPTFVSGTQFTLPGDQTSAFQVNRRVKLLVTAGTVYGYISASAFAALTTVTVVLDSGVLDSGLSNVQLGLITPTNTSIRTTSAMIANGAITSVKLSTGAPNWDTNGVFIGGSAAPNISNNATPDYGSIAVNSTSSISNQANHAYVASRFSDDAVGANLVFTKSRSASLGTNTIVQSGDVLGRIAFRGADGTKFTNGASITATVDGTPGADDMPTALNFNTTPDGAAAVVERLRVSSDGSFSAVIPSGSTLYPAFMCRAWVNFNGTGVVAIRASGNVSSITDNGVGDYSVNFTTAMPDANYSAVATAGNATVSFNRCAVTYGYTTSLVKVTGSNGGTGAGVDFDNIHVAVFR